MVMTKFSADCFQDNCDECHGCDCYCHDDEAWFEADEREAGE
jgi:hypothetical protein